jgi:putative DNA primase/helicase
MNNFNQAAPSGRDSFAHKKAGGGIPGDSVPLYFNTESAFLDAMHAAGCAPSDGHVIADGVLHRFRVDGDKPNTKNGWFLLFSDGVPSGAFGSWKHGINQTWCAKGKNELSHAERAEHSRRIESARNAAKLERDRVHAEAATKAATMWNQARLAHKAHPYLVNKGIQPGMARAIRDSIMLPVVNFEGELKSLQFINPNGEKRLLSGGQKAGNFIPVSQGAAKAKLILAEGFATAATIAEAEPAAMVYAVIDVGNMQAVALASRKQWPSIELVIACDFDEIGRTKGRDAAVLSGAKILPPPSDLPDWVTDWNDYAKFAQEVV